MPWGPAINQLGVNAHFEQAYENFRSSSLVDCARRWYNLFDRSDTSLLDVTFKLVSEILQAVVNP